ncbi:MAG: pseudouridine synthase, partial [Saccharofermentanaceae bacterium]
RDDKEYSLLQIELVTGRSHQIRAQFAHIGYPLIGDTKYGVKNSRTSICLQSNYLGFYHPINGEFLEYTIDRPNVKPWTYFESN